MEIKRCIDCGLDKPLTDFRWAYRSADGLAKRCVACSEGAIPVEKCCAVCNELKPARDFHRDHSRPDHLSATCEACLDERGVRDGKKRCRGCLEWKLLESFNSNGVGVPRQPFCRECKAKQRGGGRRLAADALIATGIKTCSTCGETKPLAEFASRSDRKRNPYISECRICRNKRDRRGTPQRHGITVDQWEKMLADQGGVCAICGTDDPAGRHGVWQIDHDHSCCPGPYSCGKCVRGLLCGKCNPAIAMFLDEPITIRRAADYLEAYHLRS